MKYIGVFVILLYVVISISCDQSVILDSNELMNRYKSAKFNIWNPWTLLLKINRDPICTFYVPTTIEICRQVKQKLKDAHVEVYLIEGKITFRGCYQFKIEKTDRIQRVRRCGFTTKRDSNSNAFISYSFEGSNNYYVYEASDLTNAKKLKRKEDAKSAELVARVHLDESVWIFKELWKEVMEWYNKTFKKKDN